MDFFKNGTGWCQRHNPKRKIVTGRKSHAPIFRSIKQQATSYKPQATSDQDASHKLQATSNKPHQA